MQETNNKAIIAMVLGIVAFFVPIPYVLGIIAIVLGSQARREIRASPQDPHSGLPTQEGDGFALAGIILGWIDIVLSTLMVIWIFFIIVLFANM